LRTFRVLAAAALAAVTLLSCATSPRTSASAPRLTTASPVILNPADSKAADLRTRLDLLLGEHVIVIAKESSAAGSRADEYTSYLRMLTSNGNDLTELVRSALGDTAATRFDRVWTAQNDYFVNYTIGLVTHNTGKADGAMSSLVSAFVPQFSQFLTTATQIPLDPIQLLVFQHVLETKAIIDDQFAQDYLRLYADIRVVYAQAARIGDAIAPRIAQKFPDKFPGNPSSQAVDLRVSMNNLLQEHAYLATMATSAATGGRDAEQAAAAGALANITDAVGTLFAGLFGAAVGTHFDQIWAAKNTATIAYSSASTGSAEQISLSQLTAVFVTEFSGFVHDSTGLSSGTLRPAIEAQVRATMAVIDDQRLKSSAKLGADDRSADASMEVLADLVVGAAITKLHARFQ
jgi:hypothetical protein